MDYSIDTIRMFHFGDIVKIKEDSDFKLTQAAFTATDDMRKMKGDRLKVSNVERSGHCSAGVVHAGGYSWHPGDLYVVEYLHEGPLVTDGPTGIFQFDPRSL